MARKVRKRSSGCDPDWSPAMSPTPKKSKNLTHSIYQSYGSDPEWSTSKSSSSGISPTPKKHKSTTSPHTDFTIQKQAGDRNIKNSLSPGIQAISREIFPDDNKSSVLDLNSSRSNGINWLPCEYCKKKKFDRPQRLAQHQRRCKKQVELFHEIVAQLQNKKLKFPARVCFTCQQAFVNASHLRRHNRRVHGNPYYQEDIRTQSRVYLKETRPRERKVFACQYCGKDCYRKDRVEPHERRCGKNKFNAARLKRCVKCDKQFASLAFLSRHEEKCFKQERNSLCPTCGKCFIDANALRGHQIRHTGNKPFACQYCESRFYTKNDLNKHERTHTGNKPYKCQQCDKWFARTDSRNSHEKTHSNGLTKLFKCHLCNKAFSQQNSLTNHMRHIHTPHESPVQCEHCNEFFSSEAKFKKHVEGLGIKKYQCTEYVEIFFREDRLEKHMEKTHENSTNDAEQGNFTSSLVGKPASVNSGLGSDETYSVVASGDDKDVMKDTYEVEKVMKDTDTAGFAPDDKQETSSGLCGISNVAKPDEPNQNSVEQTTLAKLGTDINEADVISGRLQGADVDKIADIGDKKQDDDVEEAKDIGGEAADVNDGDKDGQDERQEDGIGDDGDASSVSATMEDDVDTGTNGILDADASADDEKEFEEDDSIQDEFDMSAVEAASEEDVDMSAVEASSEEDDNTIDETSTSGSESTGVEKTKDASDVRKRHGSRDVLPEIVNLPNPSYDNFDVPTEVLIDYEDHNTTCNADCDEDECLACRNEEQDDGHCHDNENCHDDDECLACRTEMQPKVMQYITSVAKKLKLDDALRHELQLSSSEQSQTDDGDGDGESVPRVDADSNVDKCEGEKEIVVKQEVHSDDSDDDDEDDDDEDDEEDEEEDNDDDCDGANCGETTVVVKVEYDKASVDCEKTTVANNNGNCDETNDNNGESNGDDGGDSDADHNDTNGDANNQGGDGNNNNGDDDKDEEDKCDDAKDDEDEEDEDEDEENKDANEEQGHSTEDQSSEEDNVDNLTNGASNNIQNNNTKDLQMLSSSKSSTMTTDDIQLDSTTGTTDGAADDYTEQLRETEVLQSLKELCENYEELSSEDEDIGNDSNVKSRDEIVDIIKKETKFLEGFDNDVKDDNSTDSEVVIMKKNLNQDTTESLTEKDGLAHGKSQGLEGDMEVTTSSIVKENEKPAADIAPMSKLTKLKRSRGRPKIVKVKMCRYCKVNFEAEFLKSHRKVCAENPSGKKKTNNLMESGDGVDSNGRCNTESDSLPNSVPDDAVHTKETEGAVKTVSQFENSSSREMTNSAANTANKSRKRKLSASLDESSENDEGVGQPEKHNGRSRKMVNITCQYCHYQVQKGTRLKMHEVKCLEIKKHFEYLDQHPEVKKEALKDNKSYRCHFCINDMKSRHRFEQHWRLCQQRKRRIEQVKAGKEVNAGYTCRYCCHGFTSKNAWVEHETECRSLEEKYEEIMQTTPKRAVYECKKCRKTFEKVFVWERHKKKCDKQERFISKQVRKRKRKHATAQGARNTPTQSSVQDAFDVSQSNVRTLKRLSMDLQFDFTPPNLNSPRPSLRSTLPRPTSAASSPAESTTSSTPTSPIRSPLASKALATSPTKSTLSAKTLGISPSKSPVSLKASHKHKGVKRHRKQQRCMGFASKSPRRKLSSAKSTPTSSPKKKSPFSTPKKSALQLKSLKLKKKSLQQQQTSMQMKRKHSYRCRYCEEKCYNIEKLITHERKCLFLKDYSELPSQLRDHFGASFF